MVATDYKEITSLEESQRPLFQPVFLGPLQIKDQAKFKQAMDSVVETPDLAMKSQAQKVTRDGGIDLKKANTVLGIRNAGENIQFHFDPAQLAQLQSAVGFEPHIIRVRPLKNLPQFLGIVNQV